MSGPTLRVVVVTWNGRHLLRTCLDSLAQQRDSEFEVVVVDNASVDGTVEWLASAYPDYRVIKSPRNVGFAGGVSLGLRDFEGEFAVLLNNDAAFEPDAIRRLLTHARHPAAGRVAAFTAKVLLAGDHTPQLVNSTGNIVSRQGRGQDRDYLVPDGEHHTDSEVFGFCGAAVLLRMQAVREVGGFDAGLFLYYEDTDLSWRLRARDWKIHYVDDVVAVHLHAASSDETSALFRYYNTRNSLIVFTRHAPSAVSWWVNVRQILALFAHSTRGGDDAVERARRRAVRDHVRRLPHTLRERRDIWAGTRSGQRRRIGRSLES